MTMQWIRRAGLVVVCLATAGWMAEAQQRQGPGRAQAGSSVFGQKGCVHCHSVRGMGGGEGPDLSSVGRAYTYQVGQESLWRWTAFAASLWNHLPTMIERMDALGVSTSQMSNREAADLLAFLYTLDSEQQLIDTDEGRMLFREKRCQTCHQVGNRGGITGPSLDFLTRYRSPILVASSMWNHVAAMDSTMERMSVERPTFTGSELQNLILYLEAISPATPGYGGFELDADAEKGEELFASKRCNQCHTVNGRGGQGGGELAGRNRYGSLFDFTAAMWNKAPRMNEAMAARGISVPALEPEEMADIVAYLSSLQMFDEGGDPVRGARLVRSKGCADCHAEQDGTATPLSALRGNGTPGAVIAAVWNHAQVRAGEGNRWATLEATDVADIARYLAGGN